MGHRGLTSAWTHEGKTPIGEAHSHSPDIPDLQTQGSIILEPAFAVPKAHVYVHKARRPILNKGACTHPDPWPSPGIIIINLDTCIRSALQLKGEQNINLPCVGSKLHAALPAPQNFQSLSLPLPPIPLPSDTLACKNPSCGEGVTTEWCATETHCPEPSKPPDAHGRDL